MIVSFKLITAAVVLVISGSSIPGVMAQQAAIPTLRVVQVKGDMTMILAQMANPFGVTVGLELDAQRHQMIEVSLKDATLPDVMNALVYSSQKYQWREAGGVVDVWPLTGSNSLLETRISNFNVKDVNPSEAFDQLFNLPEVQSNMKAMNLQRRAPDVPPRNVSYSKFSVNVQGVNLRQVLSRIAQESGIQIWVFRNHPNGFFSISTVAR